MCLATGAVTLVPFFLINPAKFPISSTTPEGPKIQDSKFLWVLDGLVQTVTVLKKGLKTKSQKIKCMVDVDIAIYRYIISQL